MAWTVHSEWIERGYNGLQSLDLDGLGADTIRLGIVTNAVINPDTDSIYTNLTPVSTGAGWTGPVALASPTCMLDGSNNLVFDADDPSVIAQDAGTGFTDGRSLVIYEDTNKYIIAHHTEASVFGNTTGTLTITFDAAGIVKWTI